MSDGYVEVKTYPVDAAYQVALELVKAGAFNNTSDRGAAFVSTFNKIKEHFVALSKEEASASK
ncbi:hypothetical protein EX227_22980 [Providencia rettgeri]|uniref:Uncharacterized protein n=1 Tax=Providencia rettgeri TaxID=587 RepID=A0AAP2K0Z8_PRORE|nr:hypothetical protein [Providencia rettgeri]MBX6952699.1 hypothetical protein [Providencia rettgeri]MBX6957747.1 hypothetical protein [Providencia rettgeri]MBX6962546.1 hypothetical protein [Providencia rettgeri]MBX6974759.1 hypothetical protein [Providencia rettgeri]MBX6982211.1 hypothetical protein [Providencia rettgeri]